MSELIIGIQPDRLRSHLPHGNHHHEASRDGRLKRTIQSQHRTKTGGKGVRTPIGNGRQQAR